MVNGAGMVRMALRTSVGLKWYTLAEDNPVTESDYQQTKTNSSLTICMLLAESSDISTKQGQTSIPDAQYTTQAQCSSRRIPNLPVMKYCSQARRWVRVSDLLKAPCSD